MGFPSDLLARQEPATFVPALPQPDPISAVPTPRAVASAKWAWVPIRSLGPRHSEANRWARYRFLVWRSLVSVDPDRAGREGRHVLFPRSYILGKPASVSNI